MAKALRAARVLLAVATVAICLLLSWQVVDICRAGNLPENFSSPGVRIHPVYSLPIVQERLAAVAPALRGYLALVALGLILQALAGEPSQPRACREPERGLRRPWQRVTARREIAPQGKPASPALRVVLYAAAVVLIVLGVMNGGLRDVLVKAINICTECIGLG